MRFIHCGLILANLITLPNFSVSSAINCRTSPAIPATRPDSPGTSQPRSPRQATRRSSAPGHHGYQRACVLKGGRPQGQRSGGRSAPESGPQTRDSIGTNPLQALRSFGGTPVRGTAILLAANLEAKSRRPNSSISCFMPHTSTKRPTTPKVNSKKPNIMNRNTQSSVALQDQTTVRRRRCAAQAAKPIQRQKSKMTRRISLLSFRSQPQSE